MNDEDIAIKFDTVLPVKERRGIQWVDARKLHEALQVGRDFSSWIKDRIEKFNFIEGKEFSPVLGKTSNPSGGRPTIEYEITIGMAKELCMVENNDQGKKIRRYFIACEERLQADRKEAKILLDMTITERLLKIAGLNSNQVALGVNNMVKGRTGYDYLQESQIALPSPVQKAMLTPTEIGLELGGISNRKVNKMLIDKGYQKRLANGRLELTESGLPYGIMLDTGKKHGGTPVIQIKWYSNILDLLKVSDIDNPNKMI
ncbi:MAG: hypothetical protein HDQ88_09490 [Clostridia bacterium]|nr:hypothetical protein [Clostridia bacterium]